VRLNRLFLPLLLLAAPAARAEHEDILKPVDPKTNSPREDLRTKIFGADAGKPGCKTVAPGVDKELEYFVNRIVTAVKAHDTKSLQPLFHEKLNTSLAAIDDTYGRMDLVYGRKQDVSIYKLFAINTVDGSPAGVDCDGGKEKVFGLYGYPLQFGLWLQIQGPKELGRAFLHIVPTTRWNIGSYVTNQWTQGGKDSETWAADAKKLAAAGHKESAYVYYDFAIKLLMAGNHLELPVREDLIKARDALYTPDAFDKMLKDVLKDFKIAYTATMLVPDTGTAGLLVRQIVPGEISGEYVENTCADIALTLAKHAWSQDLSGVRCGFNLPREAPKDEGLQGGAYVTWEDAKKNVEKRAKAKK
jgi:hypothetical protein